MDRDSIIEYQLEKPTTPDSALNYAFLRAKVLELVQRYAGSKWTDYNLHDPGVTILEYICYAITDLAYRTGFDIREILADKEGKIDLHKNLFYPRHEILTSKPILINDFRKLIIDRVLEVHNVWIQPVTDAKGGENVKGLYNIFIQVNDKEVDENLNAEKTAEEKEAYKQKIIEQVKKVIHAQRSIGEDYHSLVVLEPADVEIEAEVVVDRHQMHEEVLAEVYEMLMKAITPPVRFYTESQLKKEGWAFEDIYSGPSLVHGFIKEEELKDRVSILDPSDMVQSILNVPGVKYVRNFVLHYKGVQYDFKPLYLEQGIFPRLVFDMYKPGIRVFSASHEMPVKTSIFSGLLHKKTDTGKRKYIKGYGHDEFTHIKAVHRQIDNYYSIQHLFPHLYRLNDADIESARKIKNEQQPAERAERAKVKQLKAYLMLFEQVLVNYLAQLANLSNIITADIDTTTANSTYFTGKLYDVPGAGNILSDFMPKGADLTEVDWELFKNDNENNYLKFLGKAIESDDVFFGRKKRILDHLLSRFNINLVKYPLQLYYQLYHQGDDKEQLFAELEWKSDILRKMVSYGSCRNQAIDYTDQPTDIRSGYDNLMAVLLYLQESKIKNISKAFEESLDQCSIMPGNSPKQPATEKKVVYEVRWDDERIDMLIEEDLLESMFSQTEQDTAVPEEGIHIPSQTMSFLAAGIDHKYYRIGPEINGQGFILLYRPRGNSQWLRVGKFPTRDLAQQKLNQFIETLKRISISSEGFHTIEHILLRPIETEPVFGFRIYDEKGVLLMQQHEWMNMEDRTVQLEKIKNICQRIADTGDYTIFGELDGLCQLNLGQDSSYTWLASPKTLELAYREQFDHFVNKVLHTMRALEEQPEARYPMIKRTVYYSQDMELDEQFFSFRMSVVLPSWPARFQDRDFREFVESLFREHAPAHVRQRFFWFSVKALKAFESVYFSWLVSIKENRAGEESRSLSKQMIALLAGSDKIPN